MACKHTGKILPFPIPVYKCIAHTHFSVSTTWCIMLPLLLGNNALGQAKLVCSFSGPTASKKQAGCDNDK